MYYKDLSFFFYFKKRNLRAKLRWWVLFPDRSRSHCGRSKTISSAVLLTLSIIWSALISLHHVGRALQKLLTDPIPSCRSFQQGTDRSNRWAPPEQKSPLLDRLLRLSGVLVQEDSLPCFLLKDGGFRWRLFARHDHRPSWYEAIWIIVRTRGSRCLGNGRTDNMSFNLSMVVFLDDFVGLCSVRYFRWFPVGEVCSSGTGGRAGGQEGKSRIK